MIYRLLCFWYYSKLCIKGQKKGVQFGDPKNSKFRVTEFRVKARPARCSENEHLVKNGHIN